MLKRRVILLLPFLAAACHSEPEIRQPERSPASGGSIVAVRDTILADLFPATGIAQPLAQATLSTRLMATVAEVVPLEGARVSRDQILIRLDTRDLDAKRQQLDAALQEAQSGQQLAQVTYDRIRALYADSAAPRAQLDAAESGLARANAGVAATRGMLTELDATASYAQIRAPFDGIVSRRLVDPGAMAAPGAPLLTVESTGTLRVVAAVPPNQTVQLKRGQRLTALIEGVEVSATIEGLVPSQGSLYNVNALVPNPEARFLAGSSATLLIPNGSRKVILIPTASLVQQGDLVGARRVRAGVSELIWLTVGNPIGENTEVLSGLADGDSVMVSPRSGGR